MTPRYHSESRVLLEARQNVFLRADADKNTQLTTIDPETVASQVQVLLSRDLARQVIKKLDLASKPEFEPAVAGRTPWRVLLSLVGIGRNLNSMTEEERTLEAYYDRLNVQSVAKSRVIVVGFNSANPQLAADVANTVASTYLRMQQVDQQSQTRAAGSWLAGEIKKLRKKVAESEAKVEQYRANKSLFVGSNNTLLPAQQLSDLNTQIAAARAQQADLQARARQLRAQLKAGHSIESSDLANSETMRRLTEQRIALQSQLAEQSTTLLPRHPRILELKAQIAETDRQIKAEGLRLASQLDNDAKVAGDRIKALTTTFDQVKKMVSQSNQQDVQLRALQREARTERELLDSYLQKYREASARDSINAAPPEARVISRASPSLNPAFPKKTPTVLIVAFAAFALSTGFTVTGALLSPPAPASSYAYQQYAAAPYTPAGYQPQPVAPPYSPPGPPQPMVSPQMASPQMSSAQTMSPPLAPAAPANMGWAPQPGYAQHHQDYPMPPSLDDGAEMGAPALHAANVDVAPDAPLMPAPPLHASSIEEIAGAAKIAARLGGEDARSIAVVGTARNVGTTYSAITLARSLAEDDASVVLVDLAFGAPNLSIISTEPDAPGIADLVRGTAASFGDVITRDQYSNVQLVAAGQVGDDAAALAASPMVATVVEALAQSYDHVVLDLGSATDQPIEAFAGLATRAVLVTGDPAQAATHAARDRLQAAGFGNVSVCAGGAQMAAA
ncbi:MAG: exopolysaccharide transport family protein [Pseudolabrys sp.]